jgi:hypothetical protein
MSRWIVVSRINNNVIVHVENVFDDESSDVLIFCSIRIRVTLQRFQCFAKYQFHLIRFSQITKNAFDRLLMNLNEIENVAIDHWNKINYVKSNF